MTGETYEEIWDLEWVGIPDFPYMMKYRFNEDGYMMMVFNEAAVYGEKLNEKAIEERFQTLNPYAEMLPKVILKHVKQSVKNILAVEQAHEKTELKITLDSNKLIMQHEFNISGVRFMFNFEPQILSQNQLNVHILRPILLRAFILDEEKAALQRKVEELEGKQSSSSSRSGERKNIKDIYSEVKKSDPPGSGFIRAFLYLQKEKITLPESLVGIPNVSPTKGIHSSSTSSISQKRIRDSKDTARNIPYVEGDSEVTLESQNRIQQSKEPEISIKIEKNDDELNMDESDNSASNFSAKAQNGKQSKNRLSPIKREMAEENSKEEGVSKPAPYLKPSPSKRKKLLKF